jgi:competence protein ComEA
MLELTLSRRRLLVVGTVALAVLALAGRFVVGAGTAQPAETLAAVEVRAGARPRVVVHVVGAVRSPGLYRLRDGSRIADAVARAGGATGEADLALVNLAAPLSDGQQVVVPQRTADGGEPEGPAGSGVVHLNTATLEELDALPGVGPVTAQKIIEYREQHGAIASVDELDAIAGIGPSRLEQLRELVVP